MQGRLPSPMHLIFLRWQASHARFVGPVEDEPGSGMVPEKIEGPGRTPESAGPINVLTSIDLAHMGRARSEPSQAGAARYGRSAPTHLEHEIADRKVSCEVAEI